MWCELERRVCLWCVNAKIETHPKSLVDLAIGPAYRQTDYVEKTISAIGHAESLGNLIWVSPAGTGLPSFQHAWPIFRIDGVCPAHAFHLRLAFRDAIRARRFDHIIDRTRGDGLHIRFPNDCCQCPVG